MHRKTFAKEFNTHLTAFLTHKLEKVSSHLYDNTLKDLFGYIHPYATWWKRIRPFNVYARYHLCGGKESQVAMQVALTSELIHLFALVHDDIVDQWVMRHDIPTYHKHGEKLYTNEAIWIGQAMLIWDLLYSRGIENLYRSTTNQDIQRELQEMLEEVIIGEIIDVHMSHSNIVDTIWVVFQKDKMKSWRYTFMRPMLMWAKLAWSHQTDQIGQLGDKLWLAFQMRDELLDITDPKPNKTSFSDHQEGNQTYLLLELLEKVSGKDKEFITDTRGTVMTEDQKEKLLDIYTQTCTLTDVQKKINSMLQECQEEFDHLFPETNERKSSIAELISFLHV